MSEFKFGRQLSASMLLLLAFTATGAEVGEATGIDACVKQRQSACDTTYEQASGRCDRYHIKGTEALPICHRSARQSREACVQRAPEACGRKTPPARELQ